MLRACALVLLCGVPVASPAFVSPAVACTWLLPCDTPGSGAVGRGLQPEDAVVVFARSCGSVCNKPPTQTRSHGTGLPMARHGLRTRPPGGDPRAADGDNEEDMDGDGRRIPSVPIPHHTYMLPARVLAPCSPPRPCDGSFAHKRAGPVVSATSWSSKLSTPRSHRHRLCIAIARFS